MSDKKLLKKCPFCGGEARIQKKLVQREDVVALEYGFFCEQCGCTKAGYLTRERAIEKWNTRKPMERIVERLEERIVEMKKAVCLLPTQQYEQSLKIVKEEGGLNDCF